MPISAPKPNSPPSANWVEALCSTIAEIDFVEKFAGGFFVFGHDRIGVMRAVIVDMGDRLVDAVDDSRRNDGVLVFGVPVFLGSRLHPGVGSLHGVVAAHFAARIDQHLDQRLETGRCAIDQRGFGRAADAGRRILAFRTIDFAISRLAA